MLFGLLMHTYQHVSNSKYYYYLTMHSIHFIYCYTAFQDHSAIHVAATTWATLPLEDIFDMHHQDSTYHGLCYTSRTALVRTRKSTMGP